MYKTHCVQSMYQMYKYVINVFIVDIFNGYVLNICYVVQTYAYVFLYIYVDVPCKTCTLTDNTVENLQTTLKHKI